MRPFITQTSLAGAMPPEEWVSVRYMKESILLRNHWKMNRRYSQVGEVGMGISLESQKKNHWVLDVRLKERCGCALSAACYGMGHLICWEARRRQCILSPLLRYKLIPWAGCWLPCHFSEVRWQSTLPPPLVKYISCSPTCAVVTRMAVTASERSPSKSG